jgi:hypothetical protein
VPSGILPDEGIADQLAYILSATISGVLPWQLLFFTNDVTPTHATVLSDLLEATWSGYARRSLDRSVWTTPTVFGGCATSTYGTDPQQYSVGIVGDVTNYGAALVDASLGVIRWIQRFDDTDIRPLVSGSRWQYLPRYTLTSAECVSMMLVKAKRRAKGEKKSHG